MRQEKEKVLQGLRSLVRSMTHAYSPPSVSLGQLSKSSRARCSADLTLDLGRLRLPKHRGDTDTGSKNNSMGTTEQQLGQTHSAGSQHMRCAGAVSGHNLPVSTVLTVHQYAGIHANSKSMHSISFQSNAVSQLCHLLHSLGDSQSSALGSALCCCCCCCCCC